MERLGEDWGPWYAALDRGFERALGRIGSSEPVVVLFSGGVDSGLLAWELRGRAGTRLSTFGVVGSPDLEAGRQGAERLGIPWSASTATPKEVVDRARALDEWVGPLSPTERAVETAFALAVEGAPPGVLVCGQGVDELFLGYAHFRPLDPEGTARRADADLTHLVDVGWPREQEIARRLGRTVRAPYLDPAFVAAANAIPLPQRSVADPPKALFRGWAKRRGLPPEIALRPKRALQFGSGVDRLLRKRGPDR